jgi:hypothetical protein
VLQPSPASSAPLSIVSTPSATTASWKESASRIKPSTIVRSSASSNMSRTKLLSIFTVSTGSRRRWVSEE